MNSVIGEKTRTKNQTAKKKGREKRLGFSGKSIPLRKKEGTDILEKKKKK